uniref:Uncharacterized protein n=1 Tax=Tetranychus urticae TaxID=32264 RepID=T1JQZ9_TETUR
MQQIAIKLDHYIGEANEKHSTWRLK